MGNPFKLRNGSLLLSTEAPGGIYNSAQLKKIAQLCDTSAAIVKVTEDQRLALFVKEDKAAFIAGQLKEVGLGIRHYRDGLHQPVSCIGELCPLHKQDALGTAMKSTELLAAIEIPHNLRIGINGCHQSCVPTHTLDISIVGDEAGYNINLGGKNTQIPELASFLAEGVPADLLPQLLRKIVEAYKEDAEPGESLLEVLERCGTSKYVRLLSPYSQDAAGHEAANDFSTPSTTDSPMVTEEESPVTNDSTVGDEEMILDAGDEDLESTPMMNATEIKPSDAVALNDSLGENDINPSALQETQELESDVLVTDEAALFAGDMAEEVSTVNTSIHDTEATVQEESHLAVGDLGEEPINAHPEVISEESEFPQNEIPDVIGEEDLSEDVSSVRNDDVIEADLASGELMDEPIDSTESLDLLEENPAAKMPHGEEDLLSDIPDETFGAEGNSMSASEEEDLVLDDNLEIEEGGKSADLGGEELEALDDDLANVSNADEEVLLDDDNAASSEMMEEQYEGKIGEEIAATSQIAIDDDLTESRADTVNELELSHNDNIVRHDFESNLKHREDDGMNVQSSDQGKVGQGWSFEGINLEDNNDVVLNFSSGASIQFNPSSLTKGRRTLRVGGTQIAIHPNNGTLTIEVDGMKLTLPAKRVA